jgi:hypothetical protein
MAWRLEQDTTVLETQTNWCSSQSTLGATEGGAESTVATENGAQSWVSARGASITTVLWSSAQPWEQWPINSQGQAHGSEGQATGTEALRDTWTTPFWQRASPSGQS